MEFGIVLVMAIVAIPIIGVSGGILIGIIKAIKGTGTKTPAADEDETRLIQEIYHGLTKMEERIETLETLLVDNERQRSEKQKLTDFDRDIERGQ